MVNPHAMVNYLLILSCKDLYVYSVFVITHCSTHFHTHTQVGGHIQPKRLDVVFNISFINWQQKVVIKTRKLFTPPNLKFTENFEDWLHETEVWQHLTDLVRDKQSPALYLSLNEKDRKICLDIIINETNSDNGVNILIKLNPCLQKTLIKSFSSLL